MNSGVVALYERRLASRGFVSDPSRLRAVERLQRLYEEWTAYKARRNNALNRLLVKPPLPKGVYLWGGVGRGKSFLMDAFYLCVPLVRKRRVHFHHFMREIHRELGQLKGTEDPIAAVAERTARRYRLICFDEFHVSDIADAMILGRYLEQVMARGVAFVFHQLRLSMRHNRHCAPSHRGRGTREWANRAAPCGQGRIDFAIRSRDRGSTRQSMMWWTGAFSIAHSPVLRS